VTKWVQRLIIANVIMFFVEQTAPGVANALVLQPRYVLTEPWTLVTYMFLHDPRSITHLLFNMLGLWLFGTRVEERLGGRRFLEACSPDAAQALRARGRLHWRGDLRHRRFGCRRSGAHCPSRNRRRRGDCLG